MGKLHTLKRAILRDPDKWHDRWGNPLGACHHKYITKKHNKWEPEHWIYTRAYRSFIKHVLEHGGVGNADKGKGSTNG